MESRKRRLEPEVLPSADAKASMDTEESETDKWD